MSQLIHQPQHILSSAESLHPNFRTRETEDHVDLRFYYQVPAKRKWLILAIILTVTGLVALQTFTTTPLYQSTARIQIDPENANILPYEELYNTPRDFHDSESYLQTQYEVLQSDTLAQRTINKLDLENEPGFDGERNYGVLVDACLAGVGLLSRLTGFEKTPSASDMEDSQIRHFQDNLEVTPVRGTRLVELSYLSTDPELSKKVVNTLADEFIQYNFETKFESTSRATDFLQKQLLELKVRVEKSEEDLIGYARMNNILNVNERENTVLQLLAKLNEEMATAKAQLIAETAHFETIRGATAESFPQVLRTTSIIGLEERLSELEQTEASLAAQFLPGWPDLVKVKKEIEEIQEQIREAKQRSISQSQLAYTEAVDRFNRLSAELDQQKSLADRLAEDSIQYNILSREVETNKQLYEGLLQRLKEAGVAAGLNSSNIYIVDHARLPVLPHWPRNKLHLALGLIMGAVLGLSLAFLIEYVDNTLKTPDEIEEFLELLSLGVIPTLDEIASSASASQQLPGNGHRGAHPALLPGSEPRSRVWEAYRSLRTSILLSQSDHPPRKMLITSAFAGEGKTTTVANTGIVLAQTGARTIVIDMDMRRSTLGILFGIDADEGVSSYLSGNSDLTSQIRQTGIPNLYIIPAGPQPPNAAELIGSERMDRLFRLLEDEFQYIVIDSPPVLSVTDAQILAKQVDGVVLVIYGGKTPRDAARKAIQQLSAVGGKVLGGMVNKIDVHKSEYSYYYRYYYDDHYYRHST